MCGRFSRFTGQDIIINRFGVDQTRTQLSKSYNIAPTDDVAVIFRENPVVLDTMRWGYIPFYADSIDSVPTPINARDDSLFKSMYKHSLKSKRCLVPADGFYEWKEIAGSKQPFYIRHPDREPLAFAGIYSNWKADENSSPIYSFAIITTKPNDQMKEIHDRMPVILAKETEDIWLDFDTSMQEVDKLIKPFEDELEVYPVSKYVNSPRNDGKRCIERLEDQPSLDDYF